jgi:hypothetical protein
MLCRVVEKEIRPALAEAKRARLALQILARFHFLLAEKLETKKPVYAPKKIGSRRVGRWSSNKRKWTSAIAAIVVSSRLIDRCAR